MDRAILLAVAAPVRFCSINWAEEAKDADATPLITLKPNAVITQSGADQQVSFSGKYFALKWAA